MEILKELEIQGKKVVIYRGKGRHLINAQIKANSTGELIWALISELVEVDGKKIALEDIYEMDLAFVLQLQNVFAETYLPFLSPQRTSLPSANTQDGASQS
jgi:hypothetical protein